MQNGDDPNRDGDDWRRRRRKDDEDEHNDPKATPPKQSLVLPDTDSPSHATTGAGSSSVASLSTANDPFTPEPSFPPLRRRLDAPSANTPTGVQSADPTIHVNANNTASAPEPEVNNQQVTALTTGGARRGTGGDGFVIPFGRPASSAQFNGQNRGLIFFQPSLQQMVVVSGATAASAMVVFVALVLPTAAFVALAVLLASSASFAYAATNLVTQQYNEIINTRGIGQFLPQWLYRTLTEQSFHDFMVDGRFVLEHRYLLLYFMPGIPREQLDQYIDRLAPRHREQLRRPGMGHFLLGPDFMRFLMGRERFQEVTGIPTMIRSTDVAGQPSQRPAIQFIVDEDGDQHGQDQSLAIRSQTQTDRRRLDREDSDDASSDLGLSITANDLVGNLSDQQVSGLARTLGIDHETAETAISNDNLAMAMSPMPTPHQPPRRGARGEGRSNNNSDDAYSRSTTLSLEEIMEEEYAEEEQVLREAAMSSVSDGIWAPFQSFFLGVAATRVLGPASGTVTRSGLYIGAASAVLGVLGYRQRLGAYSLRSRRNTVRYTNIPYPSSHELWSTALWGIGTAGLAYYVSSHIRRKWAESSDNSKPRSAGYSASSSVSSRKKNN